MNKVLLSILIVLFLFSCKKETFDNDNVGKQNALVIYFGGSWCSPCGKFGKPTKEALHKKYGNKLSILSCQVNSTFFKDSMNSEATNKMAKVFPASGVPVWFTGGIETEFDNKFGSAIDEKSISKKIDNILNLSPKTIVQADYKIVDKVLSLDIKTIFLNNHNYNDGEYFIAAYLTENNLKYNQVDDGSSDRKNIHDHVLTKSFTPNIHGKTLGQGNFNKDDIIQKTLNLTYPDNYAKRSFSVVVVVWKKQKNKKFVASNSLSFNIK